MSLRFTIRDLFIVTTAAALFCWAVPLYMGWIDWYISKGTSQSSAVIFCEKGTGHCLVLGDRFDTLEQARMYLVEEGIQSSGVWTVPDLEAFKGD